MLHRSPRSLRQVNFNPRSFRSQIRSGHRKGSSRASLFENPFRLSDVEPALVDVCCIVPEIESLYEDTDFRAKISREEFEALLAAMFAETLRPVDDALAMAGITMTDVHAVEVLSRPIQTSIHT